MRVTGERSVSVQPALDLILRSSFSQFVSFLLEVCLVWILAPVPSVPIRTQGRSFVWLTRQVSVRRVQLPFGLCVELPLRRIRVSLRSCSAVMSRPFRRMFGSKPDFKHCEHRSSCVSSINYLPVVYFYSRRPGPFGSTAEHLRGKSPSLHEVYNAALNQRWNNQQSPPGLEALAADRKSSLQTEPLRLHPFFQKITEEFRKTITFSHASA